MKGDNRRQWETTGDKTTSEPKKPTTPTNTKAARSKVALRTPTVNCLGKKIASNWIISPIKRGENRKRCLGKTTTRSMRPWPVGAMAKNCAAMPTGCPCSSKRSVPNKSNSSAVARSRLVPTRMIFCHLSS